MRDDAEEEKKDRQQVIPSVFSNSRNQEKVMASCNQSEQLPHHVSNTKSFNIRSNRPQMIAETYGQAGVGSICATRVDLANAGYPNAVGVGGGVG